jgi:hypothetical protein
MQWKHLGSPTQEILGKNISWKNYVSFVLGLEGNFACRLHVYGVVFGNL